jgi:hypothetical protein
MKGFPQGIGLQTLSFTNLRPPQDPQQRERHQSKKKDEDRIDKEKNIKNPKRTKVKFNVNPASHLLNFKKKCDGGRQSFFFSSRNPNNFYNDKM